jgi:hypothetical protein
VTEPSHHDNYTSDGENVNHEGKVQSSPSPCHRFLTAFSAVISGVAKKRNTGNFLNTYEGLKAIKKYCFNNFRLNVRYFVCSPGKSLAGHRTITTGGSRVAKHYSKASLYEAKIKEQ